MTETDELYIPAAPAESEDAAWPAQVEMILSAMESGRAAADGDDRRALARVPYRVLGKLRLFSDAPHSPPRVIYTRDAHTRGLGFITSDRLPLGYGGFVEFRAPDGRLRRIQCTLHRCRETVPGWYEGSVCFNREQPELIDLG